MLRLVPMLQRKPPSSRRRQEHLGQEACRLRLQQSFRELPEAFVQSVLLLTLLTQVSTWGCTPERPRNHPRVHRRSIGNAGSAPAT